MPSRIGENGHLAFNDPSEADFDDPQAIKVVTLDDVCRQQQVAEGWFASREEVPKQALTLTIPTSVPGPEIDCFSSRTPQGDGWSGVPWRKPSLPIAHQRSSNPSGR